MMGLDQGGGIGVRRISPFVLHVFRVKRIVFAEGLDVESEIQERSQG